MRRYLVLGLALATAGAVFAAAAFAGVVVNVNDSTTKGKFTPATIPAGKFKPGSLFIEDSTVFADNGGTPTAPTKLPDQTTHVDQFFDNSFVVTANKFLPKCTADLTGTTTAQAEGLCGPGSGNNAELTLDKTGVSNPGSAVVCVSDGTPGHPCGAVAGAVVTAFNGPSVAQGSGNCTAAPVGTKCPTIILHSRAGAPLNTTVLITGVLNGTAVGDFGYRLDAPVPLLAGGAAALTDFKVTVRRQYTDPATGKKYNYVKATCNDGDFKWNYRADFTYNSGATETATKAQTCTVG